MRGTTVSEEGRVDPFILQSLSGLAPYDRTGLALRGIFQTPFQKLIITEMEFLDLKSEADSKVLVRNFFNDIITCLEGWRSSHV